MEKCTTKINDENRVIKVTHAMNDDGSCQCGAFGPIRPVSRFIAIEDDDDSIAPNAGSSD